MAIACDKNVLQGVNVEFANENDPRGGKVSIVFALDFALEEALPVNKNGPRGGDVVSCVRKESCESDD